MKNLILLAFLFLSSSMVSAQIGYQVTLLNSATGEPRANETVNVIVSITNSENGVICSETKSATTDEFGILSLAIGNSDTFANVDWTKSPFFISATVDGVLIGKSQLLSVPVAEYAKNTGTLTREYLDGKQFGSISFTKDICKTSHGSGPYEICNDVITVRLGSSRYGVIYYVDGKVFFQVSKEH